MKPPDTESLIAAYSPRHGSVGGKLGAEIRKRSGQKPNKERTAADREMEAWKTLQSNMHFLAGIMKVIPKGSVAEREGKALLLRGWELGGAARTSISGIRNHEGKITKLVKQARLLTRQLDENLAAAMPKHK